MEDVEATIVVTFGAEGLYWHPDHTAVHEFTLAAVRMLPDDQEPCVYGATFPQGLVEELVHRLALRGEPTGLWGLNPRDFGVPREDISLTLDVRRFLPNKLRALRSHRTQIGPEHLLWGIPDDLASEFLGNEYFTKIWPKHADRDLLSAVAGGKGEILHAG
jgi:N-acetyl-1-D-myo-inositol-2-amino-2-deoxy-alpha-D-glucopyranoside deacetylase